jgi:hypothetical protein
MEGAWRAVPPAHRISLETPAMFPLAEHALSNQLINSSTLV